MDELSDIAPLDLSVTETREGVVIKAAGELDGSNIDRLRSMVNAHVSKRKDTVIFELSELTFMDTSAIALLIQTNKSVNSVRILNPSVQVRTVIEMTGLAGVLVMEP